MFCLLDRLSFQASFSSARLPVVSASLRLYAFPMIASLKIPLLKIELKSSQSSRSFLACMQSQMYFFAVEWSGKA